MKMLRFNKKVKKQLIYLIATLIIFLFISMYMKKVISIVFITIFILIGGLSKLYIRFTNIPLGFELITPLTIIFAYKINPLFAIFSAIIMLFLASLFMGRFDFPGMFMEICIFIILALITYMFNFMQISSLGVTMIILRNIIIFPTATLILGRNPAQIGIAVIVNTLVNITLMLSIGNAIVGMI
jgi:hypothetical protein